MTDIWESLRGLTIAVPESRQLDTMAQLLERRGGAVHRIPLVAIHDAPEPEPVVAWIERFIAVPPDLFIILTGEGVRRLMAFAGRHGLAQAFIEALDKVPLLCRGPKPGRALREVGLAADIQAAAPTTDGIIQTLEGMAIDGQSVAVQLFGEDPNRKLMDYLGGRHAAISAVAPYVYADQAEEDRVVGLIRALAAGSVDVIAFTSQPQFRRLQQVADRHDLASALAAGLAGCCVAAVGPVVREQLEQAGVRVDIMPPEAFFMKPLVTEIMRYNAAHTMGKNGTEDDNQSPEPDESR